MTDKTHSEVRDRRTEKALELLNSEPTEELLSSRLKELTGDAELARLGPAIFARRNEIGSFNHVGDLDGIDGLTEDTVAALISGLNIPAFEFETETLEFVQWAHGSGLEIERPDAFGPIDRRAHGIRISGLRGPLGSLAPPFGWSWVHMSIPAPSFAEGKQFYVRAVLLNFVGWPAPHDIKGSPVAAPYEIEVWDGHRRVAEERMPPLENPTNRYVRIPVESRHRLIWGLSVSLHLSVLPQVETSQLYTWIDIASVGVELVTRTGMVLTTVP